MREGPDKDHFEPRWPLAAASVPLSIWIIILSLPMWTGAFLGGPVSDQYGTGWAFRHWAANQWKALGHVPLWNPEIMGGLPFVGALHGDIFYPTAWLRLVLPTTTAMNLGFVVHYILAGIFVYALLRLLAVSWTGSVVGGLTYQLSGVIASYASPGHDGKLFVTTLLPMALIGLVLAFRARRYEGYGILALAVGLGALSPQHQMLYYLLVSSGLFALYLAFGDDERPPVKLGALMLAAALASVVVGFGIGMIQLTPFFAYLPYSPRAEVLGSYQTATSYAIPWSHVPELFFSGFVGYTGTNTYWGPNGLKLHSEYLGLASVGLACFGMMARHRRRLVLWLGGIGLLFLLVALGGSTPFYRLWWAVMPFMKQVRAPGMALYVVCLVVAAFAAFGVERLERGQGKEASTVWIIAGAAIAALGLVGVLGTVAESIAQGIEMRTNRPVTAAVQAAQAAIRQGAVASGVALLLTGAVTRAWLKQKLLWPVAGLLLLFTASADLWWNARPYWRFTSDYEQLHRADAVTKRILEASPPFRVFDPPLPSVYHGASLMALNIPQLLGHHGFELHRFDELMGGQFRWSNSLSRPLWDLYAIEFVIVPAGLQGLDSIPGFTRILAEEPTAFGTLADLYRRDQGAPAPYARLVPAAVKVADEHAIPALVRGQVAFNRLILLAEDAVHDPAPVETIPPALEAEVKFEHWEPGRMRMRIVPSAPRDAYVLVSENWYPDWMAEVDGAEAPVLRGDVSAIVVPVSAGATEIELQLVSKSYRVGKAVTGLSLVLVVIALVLPSLLRRRDRA